MKKEKKVNLKRIALGWGVAIIFAIVVAIICLIAAHSKGALLVAHAEVNDIQSNTTYISQNITTKSFYQDNPTMFDPFNSQWTNIDDGTVYFDWAIEWYGGRYEGHSVELSINQLTTTTQYRLFFGANIAIIFQRYNSSNAYKVSWAAVDNGVPTGEISNVYTIYAFDNNGTLRHNFCKEIIASAVTTTNHSIDLDNNNSGGESGGDINPEEDIPEIDTSCPMQFLLSQYYEYTNNEDTHYDTYLLGYMITNAERHLNNQGICILKIYYKDENENWTYKEVKTIRVRTASNPTVEYHYFVPYDYGNTYRIAFKEDENTSDWTVVFPSRALEANATQLDIASITNSWNLDDYLMPSRNSYVQNEVESYQNAAIGLYAGMDVVTGIFAKIGELLNVNIFGSIPLYVFILIPLIMGVVYVVLKFVR